MINIYFIKVSVIWIKTKSYNDFDYSITLNIIIKKKQAFIYGFVYEVT